MIKCSLIHISSQTLGVIGKELRIMKISLSSAVSGLRSHQIKMDVIGNNVANVNTNGFKSSNVSFADLYNQTIGNSQNGNPMQVGSGAFVSGVSVNTASSGMVATGSALDIHINGNGFLITQNSNSEMFYTRSGTLNFDAAGSLVDSSGNFVLGWSGNNEEVGVITIDESLKGRITGISIGANGEITGFVNNAQVSIGRIAVAQFSNPGGLYKSGSNNYSQSPNSGEAMISLPGNNGAGSFAAGYLEMSNVDMANESTGMIMTQRGFQANIRTITTTDEILDELINIKR